MKTGKILLLATLLVLLVGVVSATDVSTDTASTSTTADVSVDAVGTDATPTVVVDTTPTTTSTVQESVTGKQTENKEINKEEMNIKSENEPINVRNYTDLQNAFNKDDEVVTVNITYNMQLKGNPSLNPNIKNLTIEGNSHIIFGGQNHFLNIPSGTTVNIKNLGIYECYNHEDGGAINNNGTFIMTNSHFFHNNVKEGVGGAINNEGTLIIIDSGFLRNNVKEGVGGAINNKGTLNITNSYFTNNNANNGGSINNEGILNITNSNFNYSNAKEGVGGAINNKGSLIMTNSNLEYNSATLHGSAIFNEYGTYEITNTTFYNNYQDNFIITDNHLQLENPDGFISIGNFTIIADDEEVYNNAMGNLGDYTISPDIIHVKIKLNGTNTTDNTFIVTQSKEVNVNNYQELIKAIEDAKNREYYGYKINLQTGNYNVTENITWGKSPTRRIIINGNGNIIDGQNKNNFIEILWDYDLILENITITNCRADFGAILNYGMLNIKNSNFTNNSANYSGGAIGLFSGSLTITASNFTKNTATYYGGAIYDTNSATLIITDSNFNYNSADRYGGAIDSDGPLTITDSNFTCNKATNAGGAIYQEEDAADIYNNIFTNNLVKNGEGEAIIDEGDGKSEIHDNENDESSKYSSTIYTDNFYSGFGWDDSYPVSITFNTFNDQPRNTIITISTNNTTVPTVTDIINITLELKDDFDLPVAGENITVTINQNTSILTTNSTGMISIEYKLMSTETVINATYLGKEGEYNAANTTLTLIAEKMGTKLQVEAISTTTENQVSGIPITAYVGDEIILKATITDENNNPVVTGKVVFKINGKTIGTAKVQNGIATYNTTVPKSWAKEGLTLYAKYGGNNYITSNNTTAISVKQKTANIKSITTGTYTSGEEITLTAIVTDTEEKLVDTGYVIFKLNGVTIKDNNNKTLQVNVAQGLATTQYTLTNMVAKEYTITAVFLSDNYERTENTSSITINKANIHIEADPITVKDSQPATLTAKILDGNNKMISTPTKITIKINGITFNTTTTTDGTIQVTLNQSLNKKTSINDFKTNTIYNVIIIAGENSRNNGTNTTTPLIKN